MNHLPFTPADFYSAMKDSEYGFHKCGLTNNTGKERRQTYCDIEDDR